MFERIQPVRFVLSGLYFREGKEEDKFSLTKVVFLVKTIFYISYLENDILFLYNDVLMSSSKRIWLRQ